MLRTCRYCQGLLPKDVTKYSCTICGQTNLPGAGPQESQSETVIMSKVQKRTVQEKRFDVGIFNDMFGDPPGLSRTSVNLIGGPYGAGKTTLFIMLMDLILEQVPDREGLYLAFEQSDEELQGFGERLKIRHMDRVRIYNALGTGLRRPLASIVEEYKPCFLVFDSLTRAIGNELTLAEPIVSNLKELSVAHRFPSMVVNQLNKERDHAGKMEVPHAVDWVGGLDLDSKTKMRILFSDKNRNGPAPLEMKLRMLEKDTERPGYLVPWNQDESQEDDETNYH